jgi:hypothetical protein
MGCNIGQVQAEEDGNISTILAIKSEMTNETSDNENTMIWFSSCKLGSYGSHLAEKTLGPYGARGLIDTQENLAHMRIFIKVPAPAS